MRRQIIHTLVMDNAAHARDEYAVPANKCIPEYYKAIPNITPNNVTFDNNNLPQLNIKSCMPFVDALTCGYILRLPTDVYITRIGTNGIKYNFPDSQVMAHRESTAIPQIDGYMPAEFVWLIRSFVRTPSGYSSLFTHPLNRPDLPFYTFSGLVDTDLYHSFTGQGNVPFLIKDSFSGLIPKGTPMCQVIPIKRETWKHERRVANPNEAARLSTLVRSKLIGGYRKFIRQHKSYT